MGPIWGRQGPGGPHVGPMNFAIWVAVTLRICSSCMLFSNIQATEMPWCWRNCRHSLHRMSRWQLPVKLMTIMSLIWRQFGFIAVRLILRIKTVILQRKNWTQSWHIKWRLCLFYFKSIHLKNQSILSWIKALGALFINMAQLWSQYEWIIPSIIKCGVKLLIHYQTPKTAPLKFGSG